MRFNGMKGEWNGVYLNVESIPHGSKRRVTVRCSVCGREFTRSRNTFMCHDLSHCICDEFEASNRHSRVRTPVERTYMNCKTNFKVAVKEALEKNPNIKYDDFDVVWNAVGPKPRETEFKRYFLTRKHRGQRNPDFTADNMEWHPVLSSKAAMMAQSMYPQKNRRCCVEYAKKAMDSPNEDKFMHAVTLCEKVKNSYEDYKCFVGRKIKSWRIIGVTKTITAPGHSQYSFDVQCTKCGKRCVKSAAKLIKYRETCRCHASVGQSVKNSSTVSGSVIMRKRLRQARKSFIRASIRGLTQDELLILQACLSEYTLHEGTPEYIYALLEVGLYENRLKNIMSCDDNSTVCGCMNV